MGSQGRSPRQGLGAVAPVKSPFPGERGQGDRDGELEVCFKNRLFLQAKTASAKAKAVLAYVYFSNIILILPIRGRSLALPPIALIRPVTSMIIGTAMNIMCISQAKRTPTKPAANSLNVA